MTKTRRVEIIEIPTEALSYVPGQRSDRLAMAGRWSGAWRAAVVAAHPRPTASAAASVQTASRTAAGVSTAVFRRLIEVPGGRLAVALRAWWRQADHADGHLRLGVPRRVGDSWSIAGAFRRTRISRWVPVEVLLAPYSERWSLLELMPRRVIRPGRVYFREGHRSLDRFVAAIRMQHLLTERRPDVEGVAGRRRSVRLPACGQSPASGGRMSVRGEPRRHRATQATLVRRPGRDVRRG
jgi:hypothetical protein